MTTATLTSKGQITIPKPIRDALGLQVGQTVSFELADRNAVVMQSLNTEVRRLAGMFHRPGRPVITEAAMRRAVAQRAGRNR